MEPIEPYLDPPLCTKIVFLPAVYHPRLLEGRQFPLVYALLPAKSRATYDCICKFQIAAIRPSTIMSDFESAVFHPLPFSFRLLLPLFPSRLEAG